MQRTSGYLLALAVLSLGAHAQSAAGPGSTSSTSSQGAPIVRAYAGGDGAEQAGTSAVDQATQEAKPVITAHANGNFQPIAGVWFRTEPNGAVTTVSADAKGTELRVERGRANVNVHQPARGVQIMVDLPGGQVALLKDGLYTFNAETNTVRVLKGEADAYPGTTSTDDVKPIKVKEDHQVAFTAAAGSVRSVEADPRQLMADLLPGEGNVGGGGGGYPRYGYGLYGDGFYGYPRAASGWGYPWGYGYPYGYGLGFGYGYYGGFGGFRGGYGFRGYRR